MALLVDDGSMLGISPGCFGCDPSNSRVRLLEAALSIAVKIANEPKWFEELLVFALDGVEKALLPPALATPFSEFKDDNHAGEEERAREQQIAQIHTSPFCRSCTGTFFKRMTSGSLSTSNEDVVFPLKSGAALIIFSSGPMAPKGCRPYGCHDRCDETSGLI